MAYQLFFFIFLYLHIYKYEEEEGVYFGSKKHQRGRKEKIKSVISKSSKCFKNSCWEYSRNYNADMIDWWASSLYKEAHQFIQKRYSLHNGYHYKTWNQWFEFKSVIGLFAFHFMLMPNYGEISRAGWVL